MSLIKCSECGQNISTNAKNCPHCGYIVINDPSKAGDNIEPLIIETNIDEIQYQFSIKKILKITSIIIFTLSIMIFIMLRIQATRPIIMNLINSVSYFYLNIYNSTLNFKNIFNYNSIEILKYNFNYFLKLENERQLSPQININDDSNVSNTYFLEKNDIFGYQFYTGKIDSSLNNNIGSAPKQAIAKLLKNINFPHVLTKNLAFIYIDPTIAIPSDQVLIPWNQIRSNIAIQPESGTYQVVQGGAVIALNNLVGFKLSTLTHELGHHIGNQMTDKEWVDYFKLRNIPNDTPRNIPNNWKKSPNEDFAEVFKNTYKQANDVLSIYEWSVRTDYGNVVPVNEFYDNLYCGHISDDDLKNNCRIENIDAEYFGRPAYIRSANDATKQFVKGIMERLNR